jgi:DNA (cytosine-5)-methyltransferase 1
MEGQNWNELALFAGAGGGLLGSRMLGWKTVCAVECDPYAASVLVQRQNDGQLDPFPVWDDVRTFDGAPWKGAVTVVSGGFPCQGISCAGKGKGLKDPRSGLWSHMARIVGQVAPPFVFIENSPMLIHRGLDQVLRDLAKMGYDARWGIVGAHHAGAVHKRDRIWVVAHTPGAQNHAKRADCGRAWTAMDRGGQAPQQDNRTPHNDGLVRCGSHVAHSHGQGLEGWHRAGMRERAGKQPVGPGGACSVSDAQMPQSKRRRARIGRRVRCQEHADPQGAPRTLWWATEPDVGRVAHGVAARVDRLKCLGNGQVPHACALAWHLLGPNGVDCTCGNCL